MNKKTRDGKTCRRITRLLKRLVPVFIHFPVQAATPAATPNPVSTPTPAVTPASTPTPAATPAATSVPTHAPAPTPASTLVSALALLFLFLFPFLFPSFLSLPEVKAQSELRVMFYNVENLFDTKDDPLKNDDEFLPDGVMHWTPKRYKEKLRDITRVITAVGEMQSPGLIGLCEVENDSVLFDLTRRSPLRAQEYEYLITQSPDERGINVALLYQRHQFKLLEWATYEVRFDRPDSRPTRDILHAVGQLVNSDTLDLLICHFPSRSDGQLATRPARITAAETLREKVDSILAIRTRPHCIIMGDFNDPPNSECLFGVLKAGGMEPPLRSDQLYNLFFDLPKQGERGTYKYQGKWEVIDQLIINGGLLMEGSGTQVKNREAIIFDAPFLLEKDEKYYGKKPFRTYLGPRYHGGFSDHLPVYLDLVVDD
ncbi:MAG: hypothetical protein QM305_08230 [Bacteroidota bacterium]|nr:hypothetical protein [Bacteroidota bacterium]